MMTMVMMIVAGRLSGRIQPKYLIATGGSIGVSIALMLISASAVPLALILRRVKH